MTNIIDTGHNIQIVAEGSCGDLGTIFREAAGGPGGPSGPPSGPEQSSAPGGTQGDAPADTPTDIPTDLPTDLPTDPTGLLSSVMPRQAEAFDLLNDNSAILGGGAAGETMQHFGTCWDGKVTNPSNPARRDVAQLQSGSYIVIQWNQDNPGLWVSFSIFITISDYLTDAKKATPLPYRMAFECWVRLEHPRAPRRAPKRRFGDPRTDHEPVRQLERLEQGPPSKDDQTISLLMPMLILHPVQPYRLDLIFLMSFLT